ncbi:NACHT domain-containing protein [Nostoc sp.]|uniref:NACHT domain-containing protein n=1 Tax=Nostoc sp. TaxID=1180 RepID=UPI002FF9B2E5
MPKILILSSNPRRDLDLNREIADLTSALQRLGTFELRFGFEVRSQELQELLAEHSPRIVHFCGHGAGEQGLLFQDENGREQLISTEILTRIFKTFSDEINCLVLNACDSDRQAEAIVENVNYVIGMSQPILDKAALLFSVGFYKGLAAGKLIEQAYEMGCIAIQIWSETNSQSTQSRQYRKLEYAGKVGQPAQPELAEYLKPVLLKKSELFPSNVAASGSVPKFPPLPAASKPPQEFVEYVQQEAERKEYKDNARAAYDNFGQFSAQNVASLTKSEYEQRKIVLKKVKSFWIEGFLKPSLQGNAAINLDLKARPDAIADLSQGIEALSVELDTSYEKLRDTQIYEEIGQGGTLLILGSPGAGKTIALLQLAQRLIERSEQNLSLPMPVVFNLSSWAKDQNSIVDWLIDELVEKYQIPKSLSEPWIKQQQLILLLDGLDEVKEDHRNDCVRALNKFIGLFPQTEVAVCSRVRDYEALTERLQISSALCLQPLSPEQVYQSLDSVGGSLAGLKTLLKRDAELEQFAQTPLILNLMSSAYQGWSVKKLMDELHSKEKRNQHLFDTYIERRLERGTTSEFNKKDVLRWLNWLASQMVQEKQTIFLIEKMQPTWLQNQSEEIAYRIRNFMIVGLIVWLGTVLSFGLSFGLNSGLGFGLGTVLSYGLIIGRGIGVGIGLIAGLIAGLSKEILPLEKLSWSWQRAKSRLMREFFTGFIYGLGFGLIGWLIYGLGSGLDIGAIFDLSNNNGLFGLGSGMRNALGSTLDRGLGIGVIFGLGSGLGGTEVEQQTVPNQGIHNSRNKCLIIGLGIGLSYWLIALVFGLSDGLSYGPIYGLIAGLKYGGTACIQHFTLRQMLHKKNRIPWNYAKFLDFASDRLLMKKVGGGYVFFHRMLLEHFAQMDRSRVPVPVIPESTSQSIAKINPHTNVNSRSAGNISNTAPQPSNPVQNRIVCSNCSHNNSSDSKFCTKCGRQLIKHP